MKICRPHVNLVFSLKKRMQSALKSAYYLYMFVYSNISDEYYASIFRLEKRAERGEVVRSIKKGGSVAHWSAHSSTPGHPSPTSRTIFTAW
jgi:hypothetical protein